jgi:hypothetical protein
MLIFMFSFHIFLFFILCCYHLFAVILGGPAGEKISDNQGEDYYDKNLG